MYFRVKILNIICAVRKWLNKILAAETFKALRENKYDEDTDPTKANYETTMADGCEQTALLEHPAQVLVPLYVCPLCYKV